MLSRLLIGGLAYFLEEGKVVDTVTVGPSAAGKPDNDPTTNWPSLGCVANCQFGVEEETEEFVCPKTSGGYRKERETHVTMDSIALQLNEYNEFFHRLFMGFDSEIVEGTAQTPFVSEKREIKGWLKLQGRKRDGTDIVQMDVWVKMRINNRPPWSPVTGRPEIALEVLDGTDGQTAVFPS